MKLTAVYMKVKEEQGITNFSAFRAEAAAGKAKPNNRTIFYELQDTGAANLSDGDRRSDDESR